MTVALVRCNDLASALSYLDDVTCKFMYYPVERVPLVVQRLVAAMKELVLHLQNTARRHIVEESY